MDLERIEYVVVIATVQPLLLAWVAAIGFFVSLSLTAMVSPGRRWFELVVIFALLFLTNFVVVLLVAQLIGKVTIIELEYIEKMITDKRMFR
jgi:hypothetical protein